ncbi:MAG: tyrosine--tRNA ligase [Candidatus Nealsonbacteria bacterium]|nr:tyrosine--tRNA ligase [Candidatus Nealsonbacteria bacterium]
MKNQDLKTRDVLVKAVEKILPGAEALEKLLKKRKVRFYLGIDPTSPQLHLGHAVTLRKFRDLQDLGHEGILLFGTFTAQIGDPSGRKESRKPLSISEIEKNMEDYKKQASKILDISNLRIEHNHRWLEKLNFKDLVKIASCFTVSRLLERNMFQERLKKGGEVGVQEFLYPLMQGYDSVALDVDLEIGASDQLFNMMVGRKLQRVFNKKEKFVLTVPLLLGLDGRKMSKTYNNAVNLSDTPKDMYGKIMSLKDNLIIHYFELCTDVPQKEVKKLKPLKAKARLAREITAFYHGRKAALLAEKEFNRVFKEKKLPSNIPAFKAKEEVRNILDFLTQSRLAPSRSEAKRLVLQKGVKLDGKIIANWNDDLKIKKGQVLRVGKKKFVKIV